MFFKNKIEIFSNDIPINLIKNYILTYPKNLPVYFKNIPKPCPFGEIRNIKSCSGFINYYRRSIVFNSPCDILIKIDKENKKIICRFGEGFLNNDKRLTIHSDNQFLDYLPNKKYFKIIKLIFGIHIKTNIPLIVNNPWYSMNDFDIVPGILNAKDPLELNVFIAIKNEQDTIAIKQNTPLCVIHTESNKNINLVFKNKEMNTKVYNGFNYKFSTLKDRLLYNKFKKE
jgi:hypothetical protein